MEPTITVYCKNTHSYHEVPRGISLTELKDLLGIQLPYPIIAAHVNYKVENLDFRLYKPKDIEFWMPAHQAACVFMCARLIWCWHAR